jgi:2-octaprenylphenol hydroxylase
MHHQYDVVIVGGGMVGLTVACALADSGLKIAVLEQQAPDQELPLQYGMRTSAITHASRRVFEAIGAWEAMLAQRVSPFREMHVWDASGEGQIHFDAADSGVAELGYIIENQVIQSALWQRAQALSNVALLCPAQWQHWREENDGVMLQLEDGRELRARLVVGADGAGSRLREHAGIAVKGWGYDQHAVVVAVKTELSHQRTARQRFLPTGPLAFLPLPDLHYCSIVWSTTPEQATELLALDEQDFASRLGEAFEYKLGRIVEVGARGKFPLRLQHAVDYVKPRLALVGDAAHAIHPLAGQGVNLGLLDAAALAEVILAANEKSRDIGSLATLRRYERWRKGHNLTMMASMDGFKRLFGSTAAPVHWARNFGLNLTNNAGPVKHLFMDLAMGEMGDLPRLATVVDG